MNMPDKCSKQDFLAVLVQSVADSIKNYITAGFSKAEAIDRVRHESTAGKKVWDIVLTSIETN